MNPVTRKLYAAYLAQLYAANGVEEAGNGAIKFTIDPTIQQKLEEKIQESSDFLSRVNITGVPELRGGLLGLGLGSTIASRTNTSTTDRATQDPSNVDGREYNLAQTNFDTHLTYGKLDMWAKFPDFGDRIRAQIVKRCALDRIMIGWNGTSVAADTDRLAHPLLQDVNKGWLQHLREDKPALVMSEGSKVDNQITVGAGGDYATVDALVWDLYQTMLPTWAVNDTELVAIVGRKLLHDKYFPLINNERDPTEQIARDVIMSSKRVGNLPAIQVPFFPDSAVTVTRLDNLSIYYQDGKRRRTVVDNAKRDRVEDYQSSNEGYVVEDYDYICHAENITLLGDDD